jgi:nucleoside-diphosphate kinase
MQQEERTLILIKPDGVKRGLIGQVISRFEARGLKIVSLEMLWAKRDQISRHYPQNEVWITRVGGKVLENYKKDNIDPVKTLGSKDPLELGQKAREWLLDYLTSGPIVKVVVSGNHAIAVVRKLAGGTMPAEAIVGTIRGDFAIDDAVKANREKRAVKNIVHASENGEEAANELELWTSIDDIFDYRRTDEEEV